MTSPENIAVKGVRGLETVLDFDPTNENFQVLVETSSLAKTKSFNRALKKAMKSSFKEFLVPYIRSLGFNIARNSSNNLEVTVWEEDKEGYTKANVRCETAEILSNDEGDRKFGYRPQFDFRITPDTMAVESYLIRTGGWGLEILDDLLKSFILDGDGYVKPRIRFGRGNDGYDRISIASIEHMPKVLAKLKELYDRVGKEKLNDLLTFQRGIEKLEREFFHQKNPIAVDSLKQKYQEMKELLLPANRDF